MTTAHVFDCFVNVFCSFDDGPLDKLVNCFIHLSNRHT